MKVKQLKKKIENLPDNCDVTISGSDLFIRIIVRKEAKIKPQIIGFKVPKHKK